MLIIKELFMINFILRRWKYLNPTEIINQTLWYQNTYIPNLSEVSH